MGGGSSSEVKIPVNQTISASRSTGGPSTAASTDRQLENAVYKEGYDSGRRDALKNVQEDITKSAVEAYVAIAKDDEAKRAGQLSKEIEVLRKKLFRVPMRDAECQREEAAFLSCNVESSCKAEIRAYTKCADAVVERLMHPSKSKL